MPNEDTINVDGDSGNNNSGSNPGGWGGNSGDHSDNTNVNVDVLRPGDSINTPYGKITINTQGLPVMNGVIMTPDNSSMVTTVGGRAVRVLNSTLNTSKITWAGGRNPTTVESIVEKHLTVAQSIEAGIIPAGYLLKDGKIGSMQPKYQKISSGHGEYTEVYKGEQFVEIPELTAAYQSISVYAKFTADFFKETSALYGERASTLAQQFAEQAKGKKIRNVDDALATFEKYNRNYGSKLNAADRAAIVAALNSKNFAQIATSMSKYSRTFGYVGNFIDFVDTFIEFKRAVETNSWRGFFVKVEALVAGQTATGITAFVFAAMTGLPLGIIGFALMMAIIGALVDEKLMERINNQLGI
ncbi:colicin-like pore-forming protein [Enterobacter ludwigii]|uniref:colicin-like pore-forming protein n=1 Tax=Enterobacter ludwigii TaxID=299767 RepID=UPI00350C6C40